MPDRRAASRAVSRASGRMPLTLHGTPNFILSPASEVEAPRADRLLRNRRALTAGRRRARLSVHPRLFNGCGKQAVNVWPKCPILPEVLRSAGLTPPKAGSAMLGCAWRRKHNVAALLKTVASDY